MSSEYLDMKVGFIAFLKEEVQKRILIHYGLWSQIIKSILVSKHAFN